MRTYIRHIAAAFLLTVLLSGCSGPKPNPYETEELVSKNAGPAVFAVPRSWNEGAVDAAGFRYYFETEDILLNLQIEQVHFSNEEFIRSAAAYGSGFTEDAGYTNVSCEVIELPSVKALEVSADVQSEGKQKKLKNLAFVTCGNIYSWSYYADEQKEENYLPAYESFRENISVLIPNSTDTEWGRVTLDNLYIQQKKTGSGYGGWIVFVFDLSALDENQQYGLSEEYEFAFSDRSDSNDSTYLHFQNKYESAIQTDGKKYVFVSIRECDRPLAEMQLAADMDVWCFQKPSLSNQLTGACADFGITDELPESVRQIMDSTVTGS